MTALPQDVEKIIIGSKILPLVLANPNFTMFEKVLKDAGVQIEYEK